MSDSLRSILLVTAVLDVMLVIAIGLTVFRTVHPDTVARDRLISLFLIGIAAQSIHFIEEFTTGFHCRWPELLGLSPWSAEFFVSFNVSWIAIWVLSAAGLRSGVRAALVPTWFFAIAMTANGVGHPLMALYSGGYFPGLWSSPVVGVLGVMLLGRLAGYTQGSGLESQAVSLKS